MLTCYPAAKKKHKHVGPKATSTYSRISRNEKPGLDDVDNMPRMRQFYYQAFVKNNMLIPTNGMNQQLAQKIGAILYQDLLDEDVFLRTPSMVKLAEHPRSGFSFQWIRLTIVVQRPRLRQATLAVEGGAPQADSAASSGNEQSASGGKAAKVATREGNPVESGSSSESSSDEEQTTPVATKVVTKKEVEAKPPDPQEKQSTSSFVKKGSKGGPQRRKVSKEKIASAKGTDVGHSDISIKSDTVVICASNPHSILSLGEHSISGEGTQDQLTAYGSFEKGQNILTVLSAKYDPSDQWLRWNVSAIRMNCTLTHNVRSDRLEA
ncbi:hypothetical protein Ciccas_008888 [Cichlidogyrus casuarinus]|uniref:Uncharacterized protein n=1 Tax=Cichlidogyrus casuarinus TaxID=1844966 RepID=A0ABD2PYU4_9PLAT